MPAPTISRSNTGDSVTSTTSTSTAASTTSSSGKTLGENKGIRFSIKTGGKSWECTLQDRSTYERMKAARAD